MMQDDHLCTTCPYRDRGFCGSILEKPSNKEGIRPKKTWQNYRTIRPGESIIVRNQEVEGVFVLCDGWAFRYFQSPNGHRQILRFLLPGDLLSTSTVYQEQPQFSVQALTKTRVSIFSREEVKARLSVKPAVTEALLRSFGTEVDDADELTTALGQRSAEERIAYLFLHIMKRTAAVNAIHDQRYPFPIRQQQIAEIVGLTPVHVNRVIGSFRERQLIELSGGVLHVLNRPEIERIGSLR